MVSPLGIVNVCLGYMLEVLGPLGLEKVTGLGSQGSSCVELRTAVAQHLELLPAAAGCGLLTLLPFQTWEFQTSEAGNMDPK